MATEAPRLSNENLLRGAYAEVGFNLAQQRSSQQLRKVQAHAVDAERLSPMPQRRMHEPLEHRRFGAHIITAAAPVRQFSLRVDAVIIRGVDGAESVGGTEMIEHHVHDDGEASLMAGAHEVAELLHRDDARRGSVLIGDSERADGHVAPMIFFLVRMLELRARQELECIHPQRTQVVALRADITGEVAIAAGGRCALGEAE